MARLKRIEIAYFVLVLAVLFAGRSAFAQSGSEEKAGPHVVLKSLSAPVYPQMARISRLSGDVRITVSIRADGSIDNVQVLSGDPIFFPIAIESAKQSKFECRGCSNSVAERILLYSFKASTEPPDPCCCSSGHPANPNLPPTVEFAVAEDHITLIAPPVCVCPDACSEAWAKARSSYRSAKCLYLWKCGKRRIALQ